MDSSLDREEEHGMSAGWSREDPGQQHGPSMALTPPDVVGLAGAPPVVEGEPGRAWELIEPGRYMPRRIRGSLLGRALG